MRTILYVILILVINIPLKAQELQKNDYGMYEYQEVIEVEGKSAPDIFNKAKEWIALNYESSNDVIQLSDDEQNLIIAKGVFLINAFFKTGEIRHTFKIEARDGRFRVTFDRFSYYSSGSGEILFEQSMAGKKKIIQKTEDQIVESLSSLKKSILSSSDDDW